MARTGQPRTTFTPPCFAPLAHRNGTGATLDALADSISGGSINQVEVPYRVVIKSYDKIGPEAKAMTDRFISLVHELAAEGCPVEIRVEGR